MPNPTLTWEMSGTTLFAAENPIAGMSALAALISASSDWRVIAGGDGVADDYLEVGGIIGGPAEDERFLLTGVNSAGLPTCSVANKGIEGSPSAQAYWWYAGYAPDNGRTANPWTSPLPLYTNRFTGLMLVKRTEGGTTIDRVRIYSCEEQLCVMWGGGPAIWNGFIGGAGIVPPREEDGEADGRVRGLFTCGGLGALGTVFWTNASVQAFAGGGTTTDANAKAVVFDPANPNTLLKVFPLLISYNPLSGGSTNNAVNGGEVHISPIWVNLNLTIGRQAGANCAPNSPRADSQPGYLIIGTWRQVRQGPDRVSELIILSGTSIVSYTLSQTTIAANDTVYFDNLGSP